MSRKRISFQVSSLRISPSLKCLVVLREGAWAYSGFRASSCFSEWKENGKGLHGQRLSPWDTFARWNTGSPWTFWTYYQRYDTCSRTGSITSRFKGFWMFLEVTLFFLFCPFRRVLNVHLKVTQTKKTAFYSFGRKPQRKRSRKRYLIANGWSINWKPNQPARKRSRSGSITMKSLLQTQWMIMINSWWSKLKMLGSYLFTF